MSYLSFFYFSKYIEIFKIFLNKIKKDINYTNFVEIDLIYSF